MPVFASQDASTFELSLNLGCWALNFFDSLAGLFISLFLLISHDDLDAGSIEPVELSNNLNQFLPWDYLCSAVYMTLSLVAGPWYLKLLAIPLFAYNVNKFMKKEHRSYFITRREYQQQFSKMEWQFKIKSAYYGILFAASLIMFIITLIDLLGSIA